MKTTDTSSSGRIVYLNASLCDQPLARHSSERGTAVDKEIHCYNSKRMSIAAPWGPRAFDIWVLLLCTYFAQRQNSRIIKFRSIRSILLMLGKKPSSKYYDYLKDSLYCWSKTSIHAENISIPAKDRYEMRDTDDYTGKRKKVFIGTHGDVYIEQVFISEKHDSTSGAVRIELSEEWLELCGRKPLATVDIDAAIKIQAPYSLNLLLYLSAYRQKIIKDGHLPRNVRYLASASGIKNAGARPIKELYRMLQKACTDVSVATGIQYKLKPRLKEQMADLIIDEQLDNSYVELRTSNNVTNIKARKRVRLIV